MMSSSTRYSRQAMQIYQDPDSYDHAPMPQMHHNTNGVKVPSPLRIIKNASSRRNVVFNPPSSAPNKPSPLKSTPQDSSSPTRTHFNNKLNMISMPPPGTIRYHSQTDSMEKKPPNGQDFQAGPQKALFTTFNSSHHPGKENYHPNMYQNSRGYGEGLAMGNFSLESMYNYQTPQKRVLMDSPPLQESARPYKRSKTDQEPMLPSPLNEQFPPLFDDGTKPGHSYAQLIGMAILRAPNRRLTLAQIYKWISDTYSFYGASDAGWQNSIRHNLSLNKAFTKQERPKDDPGKGNYWAIESGMEAQFLKDKSSRKNTSSSDQINPATSTPAHAQSQDATTSAYKPLMPAPPLELPVSPSVFSPAEPAGPPVQEPSSDATIPASDSPDAEHEVDVAPFSQPIQSSPPAIVMQSSPPVPRQSLSRSGDDTPPSLARFSASSNNRVHKRGFASMDDSGYFSSLNSSVLRGIGEGRLAEADRPKRSVKRGRAEEAIARLRGSSYDSPTKARSFMAQAGNSNNYLPPSSSPLRRGTKTDANQMLPPLTPAVKLKAPAPAPPSVSPNTNLKMHRDRVRQLVGSPDRNATSVDDSLLWTPQFRLTEESYPSINFDDGFDIFADTDFASIPGNGSPAKRTRPGLERAQTTTVLSDISSSAQNGQMSRTPPVMKLTPAPKLAPSVFEPPAKLLGSNSPMKSAGSVNVGAFDLPQEDFLGAEFLSEEVSEFDGVDIMQGFQKIGAGGQRPRLGTSRPGFGRSFTTMF